VAEQQTTGTPERAGRRGPDVLTLVASLVCLVAAVLAMVGWMPGLPSFNPRWVLAGAAVLIGSLMLVSSIRSRQSTRETTNHRLTKTTD
jgi:prepilin signal peptidase PulO-like enzyme (type II secretory pathway)